MSLSAESNYELKMPIQPVIFNTNNYHENMTTELHKENAQKANYYTVLENHNV